MLPVDLFQSVAYADQADFKSGDRCPVCGSCLLDDGNVWRCSFIMCDYEEEK